MVAIFTSVILSCIFINIMIPLRVFQYAFPVYKWSVNNLIAFG